MAIFLFTVRMWNWLARADRPMTKEEKTVPLPLASTKSVFDHLVVDSGPLLQDASLGALGRTLYTVPEVLAEIRDEATRERLARLPSGWIRLVSPSPDALLAVKRFAASTGDAASLSAVDMRVIALALTLEQTHNPGYVLPTEPVTLSEPLGATAAGEGDHNSESKHKFTQREKKRSSAHVGGGWITPDNIAQVTMASFGAQASEDENEGEGEEGEKEGALSQSLPLPQATVACISTDFAVQNVLLQMRLKAVGPEGYRIRRLKNWLLRCHACYWTTRQMERRFCDRCGGPTLIRTSYRVTDDGRVQLFLKKSFQYNNRGTMAPMPLPRNSGPRADREALLLREDQAAFQRATRAYERQMRKETRSANDLDAIDDRLAAIFGTMNIKGTSVGRLGPTLPVIGFGRRNPNVVRRKA